VVAAALKLAVEHDPTVYPIRDDMGEGSLQRLISELLRPLLAQVLCELGVKAFVGADQYIFYEQFNSTASVAPDVYVMPGFDQDIDVDSWKTWETGVVPSFALEIVSKNRKKDTERSPARYAEMGAKEVVIFDPKSGRRRSDAVRWLVYRQVGRRGLVNVEATNADRVYSKQLGLWLRVVGTGPMTRVRLGRGPKGDELIPTATEAREAADAARKVDRAARAAADAAREAADVAREVAEAEVARLRAELERLRGR
jgi:hypothetical protein